MYDIYISYMSLQDLTNNYSKPWLNIYANTMELQGNMIIGTYDPATSYEFPVQKGSNGQLLGINADSLDWVSPPGPSAPVTGTANEITVLNNNVALSNDIILPGALSCPASLEIGASGSGNEYTFPSTKGTASQVLGMSGGNLLFINQASNTYTGTSNQIDISGGNVISLDPAIVVPGSLTMGNGLSQYSLPTIKGTNGQVLGMNAGSLSFINTSPGTIITGTANEIDITNNVVSLDSVLIVPGTFQMGSSGTSYNLPIAKGNANDVLQMTSGSPSTLAFQPLTLGGGDTYTFSTTDIDGTQYNCNFIFSKVGNNVTYILNFQNISTRVASSTPSIVTFNIGSPINVKYIPITTLNVVGPILINNLGTTYISSIMNISSTGTAISFLFTSQLQNEGYIWGPVSGLYSGCYYVI